MLARGYRELEQHFPRPGWVEHDPEEIWASVEQTAAEALAAARVAASELEAIGITNQRETTVVWERGSGRPVHPAIVWQDRRTADRCAELPVDLIRQRTGLVPDPYFSATKLEWILARASRPRGTRLRDGRQLARVEADGRRGARHRRTNASRTMLLDLATGEWDDELLSLFGVDRALLPEVDLGRCRRGVAPRGHLPVAGIAGDQQAALFGQACFEPGQAKATYGTGTFVLARGRGGGEPADGLLTTRGGRAGRARRSPPRARCRRRCSPRVAPRRPRVIVTSAEIQRLAETAERRRRLLRACADRPRLPAVARRRTRLICALTGPRRARSSSVRRWKRRLSGRGRARCLAEVAVLRATTVSPRTVPDEVQADLLGTPVEVAANGDARRSGRRCSPGSRSAPGRAREELASHVHRGARYEPRMAAD